MTETSHCLYSHPKFFCTIGASIFSLQAHTIQSHGAEISKAVQSLSAVSCTMSCILFHESETTKDQITFWQVQQSFLCGFFVFSLCISTGKSSFLPKWLSNSIRSLFNAHLPLEVDWCCKEQMCLIVMKRSNLLKHLKPCSIVFERDEEWGS